MKVFFIENLFMCLNSGLSIILHLPNPQLTNHVRDGLIRVALIPCNVFLGFVSSVPGFLGKEFRRFPSFHSWRENKIANPQRVLVKETDHLHNFRFHKCSGSDIPAADSHCVSQKRSLK